MAKLSELVHLRDETFLTIQGVDVPAMFTFKSINAIEEGYGKGYKVFEVELNNMLKTKQINIRDEKTQRLTWALVYGLLVGGGTECTYDEMNRAVPFTEIPTVLEQAMQIMLEQDFQMVDIKK